MAEVHLKDLTGNGLTCGSEEALAWFNKAVFAYTTVRENGVPFFNKALELDNSIVLGRCVLVCSSTASRVNSSCYVINKSSGIISLACAVCKRSEKL